jgi:ABC-2 type transport system permease protein
VRELHAQMQQAGNLPDERRQALVSLWMPTHWAIDRIDAMTWRGLPLRAALLPVVALLGFTLLFYAVALARFQWEE